MNNTTSMKEIERRINYFTEEGIACGPVSIVVVDAEIVVEDSGSKVYLHGQWVDAASEEILFEATKESVYDVYMKLNGADEDCFDELIKERDRIDAEKIIDDSRYGAYYEELKEMIFNKLEEEGLGYMLDEEDYDEE